MTDLRHVCDSRVYTISFAHTCLGDAQHETSADTSTDYTSVGTTQDSMGSAPKFDVEPNLCTYALVDNPESLVAVMSADMST